jgi:hypothetical protein
VCAADKVHNGNVILADLKRTLDPDTVWSRFAAGRSGTVRWYRRVFERLHEVGFDVPIMDELREVAEELERAVGPSSLVSR